MQEPNDLTPANRELERALKSVRPVDAHVDPVAAAFAAGRRSAENNLRVWKAAAVLALFVGMGSMFLIPTSRHVPAPADVRQPVFVTSYKPAPVPDQSVAALQQAMAERGLAGLPATRGPAPRPVRANDFF